MSQKKFALNRRVFIEQSALTTALGMLMKMGMSSRSAAAQTKDRRHLINIHSYGGWDTLWGWSPLLESQTAGLSPSRMVTDFYGHWNGTSGGTYNPDAPGNAMRFPDSDAFQHDGAFFGPIMSLLSATDLNEMFFWRGIKVEAEHNSGNVLVQNGHPSPYAISTGLIVADYLAKNPGYPRALHYVQGVNSPEDLFTQIITYKGPYGPINLPDITAWKDLTEPPTSDILGAAPYSDYYKQTMETLSNQSQRYAISQSYNKVSNQFYNAFQDALSLYGKRYATDLSYGFQAIWDTYKQQCIDDFEWIVHNRPAVMMTLKHSATLGSNPSRAQIETFLSSGGVTGHAFRYALAEFLIKNDLSAVVEIPSPSGDHHLNNISDLRDQIMTLSYFKTLMRRLKASAVSDGSGRSLLDITTLVLSTEFDRHMPRGTENPGSKNPGTSHGNTASFILAGMGVNGGKVRGHRMPGSLSPIEGFQPTGSFGMPVPLDLSTGQPSATGTILTQRHLLPTVCAIFGAPVPPQQETEAKPFKPAMKLA